MGYTSRYGDLETYLDSIGADWQCLGDSDYESIYSRLNSLIDSDNCQLLRGDAAYSELCNKLPLSGYVFSAPNKNHLFSIGGSRRFAFVYSVGNLTKLDREEINSIECVIADDKLSFACSLNHEWQYGGPEIYVERPSELTRPDHI